MKSQGDSTWVQVVLSEGKNREIRRMLARLNHKVLRLRRIAIGPVQLDVLPKGKSRKLSLLELNALRCIADKAAPAEEQTPPAADRVQPARPPRRAHRRAAGFIPAEPTRARPQEAPPQARNRRMTLAVIHDVGGSHNSTWGGI